MKLQYTLFVVVSILISCKQQTTSPDTTNTPTLDTTSDTQQPTSTSQNPLIGAWELEGYYNYIDNKVKDSSKASANHRQVKMYTNNAVMWSKKRPLDSTEWFAYGKYILKDGKLTEYLEYGSKTMAPIMQERKNFTYEVIVNGDRFNQIELDEDGNRIYSENYIRIK